MVAEDLNSEYYRAEISELNREIVQLRNELRAAQTEITITDRYDPFDNPTEYRGFRTDYTRINPRIAEPGYKLPLSPGAEEKKNLRKLHSIAGFSILSHFLLINFLELLILLIVTKVLGFMSPQSTPTAIRRFINATSISTAINSFVYISVNLLIAFRSMKRAGINRRLLIRTTDYSLSDGLLYSLIGVFIWYFSTISASLIERAAGTFGFTTIVSSYEPDIGNVKAMSVYVLYSCLLAPITEEIFFRGMLLRVLSKADQRFAVYTSALFFGLCHGNIPQFILAFLTGLFLAHITLRHGSVIPAAGVHIFVNSVSLAQWIIKKTLPEYVYAAQMVIIIMGILGLLLLLVFRISDKIPLSTPHQTRRAAGLFLDSAPYAAAFTVLFMYMIYKLFIVN